MISTLSDGMISTLSDLFLRAICICVFLNKDSWDDHIFSIVCCLIHNVILVNDENNNKIINRKDYHIVFIKMTDNLKCDYSTIYTNAIKNNLLPALFVKTK